MKTRIIRTYFISFLLLPFAGCVTYFYEDGLFHPSHATISTIDSVGVGQTRKINMELEVAPNTVLRGYRITQPGVKTNILFLGGNYTTVASSRGFLDSVCIRFNAQIFAFDWRGYGFSDGTPSLRAIASDAVKIFDFVQISSDSMPIVIIGRSLGSGVGTYVAANRNPYALILISPPANINTVVESWSHFWPWYLRPFVRIKPDSSLQNFKPQPVDLAQQITCPTLIMHGNKDDLIPISSGEELFDSLKKSRYKKFITLSGYGHYAINMASGAVADSIAMFLNSDINN